MGQGRSLPEASNCTGRPAMVGGSILEMTRKGVWATSKRLNGRTQAARLKYFIGLTANILSEAGNEAATPKAKVGEDRAKVGNFLSSIKNSRGTAQEIKSSGAHFWG